MIQRWIYVQGESLLRRVTGMKLHPRHRYQMYLASPRWQMLRRLRLWLDGNRCTYTGHDGTRCHMRTTLQIHHKSYRHKGKSFLGELFDCETRCDAHHDKDS